MQLELSYVYLTIIMGIAVSLIFTELTGISAGGIVVPANLALGGIFDSFDALTSVGVITAALIASTIAKQGIKYTLIGTVTVTAIVYVGVQIIALI